MRRKVLAAAVVTMMGLCAAAPNLVEAGFKLRVDNYSNPVAFTNWASNDVIQAQVWWEANEETHTVPSPWDLGAHDRNFTEGNWSSSVSWLEMWNSGYDVFVIDQVEIFNDAGTKIKTFGSDDELGWCLSSDPNDGGGVCVTGDAKGSWYFNPQGDVYSPFG